MCVDSMYGHFCIYTTYIRFDSLKQVYVYCRLLSIMLLHHYDISGPIHASYMLGPEICQIKNSCLLRGS